MGSIAALVAAALFGWVSQLFADLLGNLVAHTLPTVLDYLVGRGDTLVLFSTPWVRSIIGFTKALGVEILIVRLVYEMVMHYLLLKAGEEADPIPAVRRFAVGLAFIATTPWVAEQVFNFGNLLAGQIVAIGWGGDARAALARYFSERPDKALLVLVLLALIALLLLLVIMFQMLIRSVEALFLAITGPLLSVGIISPNMGTFAVWWRELIVLGLQHAAQMLMVITSCALLTTDRGLGTTSLFVASLYVACKTPAILRQYSSGAGVGGAISSIASTAVSAVIFRAV